MALENLAARSKEGLVQINQGHLPLPEGASTGPVMDYDSPLRPIRTTRPQYLGEDPEKKIEGRSLVEILIDCQGRVVRARAIQSVPLLDAAALRTVYQWTFPPAVKHGRPVPTIVHAQPASGSTWRDLSSGSSGR